MGDREDRGRERYLKRYFKRDVNDPLLYHLTINTDPLSEDEVVRLMGEVILDRIHSARSEMRTAA